MTERTVSEARAKMRQRTVDNGGAHGILAHWLRKIGQRIGQNGVFCHKNNDLAHGTTPALS
jgi:hypothetical protein